MKIKATVTSSDGKNMAYQIYDTETLTRKITLENGHKFIVKNTSLAEFNSMVSRFKEVAKEKNFIFTVENVL